MSFICALCLAPVDVLGNLILLRLRYDLLQLLAQTWGCDLLSCHHLTNDEKEHLFLMSLSTVRNG
jgi:hypothetical protein